MKTKQSEIKKCISLYRKLISKEGSGDEGDGENETISVVIV